MAKISRFVFAALAAMSLLLTACGGGEEMAVQPTAAEQAAARQAFTGPAVVNAKALAAVAPSAASRHGSVVFVAETLGQTAKKAQALAVAPTGITQEELLNWAEKTYPDLFPSHQTTGIITLDGDGDGQLETIAYRYWPETGNYAGVQTLGKDVGGIYLYGTLVGNVLTRYAHTNDRGIKCLVNVEVEGCRPKVTSVTPVDGATGVDIKNVIIKASFDQRLACPPGPITGTFGAITGTFTCTNAVSTAEVVIVATTLPDNSRIAATLAGFRSAEGNFEMVAYGWSFTTRKGIVTILETKVLTVNLYGHVNGRSPASILDPTAFVVDQQVDLPKVPGYLLSSRIHVDMSRDVAYVGAGMTFVLYRFNPKTGEVLPAISIEDSVHWNERSHGIQGITGSTSEVCVATGVSSRQSQYEWRNRLICFNPDTGARTFTSATDFLGTVAEIPTAALYSTTRQKYYVLMAAEGCRQTEGENGNGRDGYCAGSVGRLIEINATTKARERSWNVGSMPLNARFVGDKIYVLKSGDRGLTIIDLTKQPAEVGAVKSVDWTRLFGKYAYPVDIEMDEAKGVYYVSDWLNSVRVMSLATNEQIGTIALPAGRVPRAMRMVAGNLWVLAPLRDIFYSDAQTAYVINTTSRAVTRSITGIGGPTSNSGNGSIPWDLAVYERTEVR